MIVYGAHNITYSIEKDVFEVLEKVHTKDLDNKIDFTIASVAFAPSYGQDREIDFLLVGKAGVFALEVKGGKIVIKEGDWYSEDHNGIAYSIDPFRQVNDAYYSIWRFLNSKGAAIGEKTLGYYGVIFPEYKYSGSPVKNWDKSQYLDDGFMLNPTKYLLKLLNYTHTRFNSNRELTSEQVENIRNILVPDYDNYIPDMTAALDNRVIALSEEQLILVGSLAENNKILVNGPAGSGKTILAIEQLLQNEKNKIKSLYICLNDGLRNKVLFDVSRRLKKSPKYLDIKTIHEVKTHCIDGIYESLVADEAQDYLTDVEFEIIFTKLKHGIDSNMRIFYDTSQNTINSVSYGYLRLLKDDPTFTKYELRYNYRNTESIVLNVKEFTNLETGMVPPSMPSGPSPDLYQIPYISDGVIDWEAYALELSEIINNLLTDGFKPHDIMLIGANGMKISILNRYHLDSLLDNIPDVRFVRASEVDWSTKNNRGIVFGSVNELKGIDAKVGIVTDLLRTFNEAPYTAMSRARTKLIVFYGNYNFDNAMRALLLNIKSELK